MFQIVRLELDRNGHVVACRPLQPLYELWDDAMALAEFDASRCATTAMMHNMTAGGHTTMAAPIAS